MTTGIHRAIIAGGLILIGYLGWNGPTEAGSLPATYASTGAATSVPFGWVDFCARYSGECEAPVLEPMDINLSAHALKQIEQVNHAVNSSVEAISDMDHWGVQDRWDYPIDGKGDCEDYALLKRKILIEAGFPRQALLMTVVKDTKGEGHAVLTVTTSKGDFVLDNLDDQVRPWEKTGYRFVKRQSQEDPNIWVQIGTPVSAPLYTAR